MQGCTADEVNGNRGRPWGVLDCCATLCTTPISLQGMLIMSSRLDRPLCCSLVCWSNRVWHCNSSCSIVVIWSERQAQGLLGGRVGGQVAYPVGLLSLVNGALNDVGVLGWGTVC